LPIPEKASNPLHAPLKKAQEKELSTTNFPIDLACGAFPCVLKLLEMIYN
jgi:hypothetical protein